ncbi:MAG: hypothetical protein ABFD89_17590 [Bryobacteraceae bacterium]
MKRDVFMGEFSKLLAGSSYELADVDEDLFGSIYIAARGPVQSNTIFKVPCRLVIMFEQEYLDSFVGSEADFAEVLLTKLRLAIAKLPEPGDVP